MTEDEAKTKWCPFGRAAPTIDRKAVLGLPAYNRCNTELDDADPHCIASACMAWRWSEPKRTAAFLEAVQAHMLAQPKPNFNSSVQAVFAETGGKFSRVEGHCGLAGAPQ